jgi:alpha-ketoglutarate-dependent taurine dioxygenase
MSDIQVVSVSSLEDAVFSVDEVARIFVEKGVVLLRGHKFSTKEQLAMAKILGDKFSWNVCSDADSDTLNSAIYSGGHSSTMEKDYNQTREEYVLDWHIEQVYYVYPILAGLWNMTVFTADSESGNTRFVDSIGLFESLTDSDKEFLSLSVVAWDKPLPNGSGPFFTPAVSDHPISKKPTLRVETDRGCISMPELALWSGVRPTVNQIETFDGIMASIKSQLLGGQDIRYSQKWQEGDLLIVDLFRMYHAVMGGFKFGQRIFTGIVVRPKNYTNNLYDSLDKI